MSHDIYRFVPLPDITAYELAQVVAHAPELMTKGGQMVATDEAYRGFPNEVRRHFRQVASPAMGRGG